MKKKKVLDLFQNDIIQNIGKKTKILSKTDVRKEHVMLLYYASMNTDSKLISSSNSL